jgi:hypothetical protein
MKQIAGIFGGSSPKPAPPPSAPTTDQAAQEAQQALQAQQLAVQEQGYASTIKTQGQQQQLGGKQTLG